MLYLIMTIRWPEMGFIIFILIILLFFHWHFLWPPFPSFSLFSLSFPVRSEVLEDVIGSSNKSVKATPKNILVLGEWHDLIHFFGVNHTPYHAHTVCLCSLLLFWVWTCFTSGACANNRNTGRGREGDGGREGGGRREGGRDGGREGRRERQGDR